LPEIITSAAVKTATNVAGATCVASCRFAPPNQPFASEYAVQPLPGRYFCLNFPIYLLSANKPIFRGNSEHWPLAWLVL
jgi:hypothetical protein